MAFVIDDAFLPATLSCAPMTDEEFTAFCSEHPDLRFEMTAEGEVLVMAPTHSETSDRNTEISAQLRNWAKMDGRGKTFDSSGGFVLRNGARRSPNASWILKSRIAELDPRDRKGFYHLCPDFVIELPSESGRPRALAKKMAEYLANGAQLGWIIDPDKRSVTIFRTLGEPGNAPGPC